jgi:FtsP/CotA-like multicopper oxidase with cupredoxin domain
MLFTVSSGALLRVGLAVITAFAAALTITVGRGAGEHHHGANRTRTFYIAADEVAWDYAPRHRNTITGQPFGPTENVFVKRGTDRIGSVYRKSLYRQYTDATFTKRVAPTPATVHLGFLGPTIHAEVGDTIRVVFRNNTRYPANMHPHGVFYDKASEGAPYADGTSGKDRADDRVAPGGMHTYIWNVPERAGPASHDDSSVAWMYHGHVDEPADTYSGLMGTIVVTRAGEARPDGTPRDINREFVATYWVVDENQSHYLARNVRRYTSRPRSVDVADDGFIESNLMHSINGYVYGNGPPFRMREGERVRWYVMAMGSEVDLHTPHWHGNTVTMPMRTDVVSLLPASMVTADMRPDDRGIWLFHCHVGDHITAGMQALYDVG